MFEQRLYQIVRNSVSEDMCSLIDRQAEMVRKFTYFNEGIDQSDTNYFSDNLCKNSFPLYGWSCTDALLQMLQPKIEEITKKKLLPTYSYMRIYYPGSDMRRHIDRPSCEYSASLCISNDPDPWELWVENLEGRNLPILLYPGDMLVYSGVKLPHWRTPYQGNRQTQVFFHYVDEEGKYKDFKYDCRQDLGIGSAEDANLKLIELFDTHGDELRKDAKRLGLTV